MKTIMKYCSMMMLIMLIAACSNFNAAYNARPPEPLNMDRTLKPLQDRLEKLFENESKIRELDQATRNEYIHEMITIINVNYSKFVHDLQINRRDKDMVVDVTTMSLGLAGTAVGSSATKSILAAISSGITSTSGFIDKNYFYSLTLPSMIAQMDKDRKVVYFRMFSGMQKDIKGDDPYPWAEAAQDLIDYYNAGTLPHAAASISADAGEKKGDVQFDIDKEQQEKASKGKEKSNDQIPGK